MLGFLTLIIVGQAAPAPFDVAVTLDDLPFVGPKAKADTANAADTRIVEALRKHHAPATGFVTCSRLSDTATLDPWLRAKVPLENHSTAHKSIDSLSPSDWDADVRGCNERLTTLAHATPKYFRFPFLMTGATPERREAALKHLREWKLTPAPVTIDTSEWALAAPYVKALDAHDEATASAIRAAYVEHVLRATAHYRAAGREATGREVRQVLLLHANALAADTLDPLLTALEKQGAHLIEFSRALEDPVFARPDQWAGKVGLSWLYRIGPHTRERWSWDDAEETALEQRFSGATFPADGLVLGESVTLFELEPGLYVVRTDLPLSHNAMVAEMADGTLLIAGSTFTPEPMARLIEWLRARYGPRKLVAIDTHHHWDASAGNAAVTAAGGETWASDLNARLLVSEEEPMRKGVLEMLASEPEKQTPFRTLHVEAPQHTFPLAQGKVFDFGGEEARVIFPGPAHARDTVVVWLPRRQALFGGCAVVAFERPGNLSDADLSSWPKAIASLKKLEPKVVVPGHGERHDSGLLDNTLSALRNVSADAGR